MLTTENLVQESVSLMRRGKRLEDAIKNLSEATKQKPDNAEYALLLACALAERAHALAEIAPKIRFADFQRKGREKEMSAWEAAQKDARNPLYGKPKPELSLNQYDNPPTPDDDKPVTLTEEQFKQRLRELSAATFSSLETAEKLSRNLSVKERASLLNLCGWTALVLWHGARRVFPDSWPKKKEKAVNDSEDPACIFAYIDQAKALDPENQGYMLAVAEVRLIAAFDQARYIDPPTRFDKAIFEQGKAALITAAKRRPRDGALWFYLSCLEGAGIGDEGKVSGLSPRTPDNLSYLRKAAEALSSNALVWYTLAAAQSSTLDDEGALESITKGNNAPLLEPIRYKNSAPTLMRWVFAEIPIVYPMQTVLLGRWLIRTGKTSAEKEDKETLLRTYQTALQMSEKFARAAQAEGLTPNEKVPFLVNSLSMKDISSRLYKSYTDGTQP